MPGGDTVPSAEQSDSNTPARDTNAASRLPPLSQASPLAVKGDDLRQLVLEYLSHSCYVDSAIAFAKEWDQAEGTSTGSVYAAPGPSASAGPSQSRRDAAIPSTSSAAQAGHTVDGQYDDDTEDQMMQSVHGDFVNPLSGSNGYNAAAQNGDSVAAYQDRHYRYPGNKHLSQEQIEQIRARKEIKRLVRQGSIQSAIDLCNLHFPSVLDPTNASSTKSSTTTLHPSSSPSYWPREPRPPASSSLLGFFNRRALRSGDNSPSAAARFTNNLVSKNVPPQPSLLSLSLQIQLFIEVVRSAAPFPAGTSVALASATSISRPSTPLNNSQSPGSANGSMDGSTASLASNTSQGSQASRMSILSNGSSSSTAAISQALSQAQSLHAQASQIVDAATKSVYLKELEAVSGLLPYRDPRNSPMAFYLDESRRDTLAEALNGAILLSIGMASTNSKLENVVRQNDQVWHSLHDLKCTYPVVKGANKNDPPKPILPFSLEDFLDAS